MPVTSEQVRRWIVVFPSHPVFWFVLAGALVIVFANRTPQPSSAPGTTTQPQPPARVDRSQRVREYAWLSRKSAQGYAPLVERLPAPGGYMRADAPPGSFADWLRHLPVLPATTPVVNGQGKTVRPADDPAIAAVIDLSPTNRGLLGAANMLTRLRGEYLYARGRAAELNFSFTSGEPCPWSRVAAGERPIVRGKSVTWKPPVKKPDEAPPRATFTAYMETLLPYASVISLERDTRPIGDREAIAGDLFVSVGRPGHAVTILDVAVNASGQRVGLLGEGGTPPQTFHVLRNADGSAWFPLTRGADVTIPTFAVLKWRSLRCWQGS